MGPDDSYDFSANCPGNCNDGRMGLEEKVASMVQNKETECDARAMCQQPNLVNPSEPCGCKLECRIEIRYSE